MSTRQRWQIPSHQKVEIVKRHPVDSVAISDRREEHKIQPIQFYAWQKQLFENSGTAKSTSTTQWFLVTIGSKTKSVRAS